MAMNWGPILHFQRHLNFILSRKGSLQELSWVLLYGSPPTSPLSCENSEALRSTCLGQEAEMLCVCVCPKVIELSNSNFQSATKCFWPWGKWKHRSYQCASAPVQQARHWRCLGRLEKNMGLNCCEEVEGSVGPGQSAPWELWCCGTARLKALVEGITFAPCLQHPPIHMCCKLLLRQEPVQCRWWQQCSWGGTARRQPIWLIPWMVAKSCTPRMVETL